MPANAERHTERVGGEIFPYDQVVTLWEIMNRLHLEIAGPALMAIGAISNTAHMAPSDEVCPNTYLESVRKHLETLAVLSLESDLRETSSLLNGFVRDWTQDITWAEIRYSIDSLYQVMMSEMGKRAFFVLSPSMKDYYKVERPLGDAVYDAFPDARFDLTEAGTCLALRCNVACGFHLMRAVEVGMRELGKDRQIPYALSGEIDFKEWGQIIRRLEEAVKAIQQWPNSHTKEDAHRFYNSVLTELRAFNDGWRRHAAHVRPNPEIHDDKTLALWGHVRRFMSILATTISEGQYTKLIW